eukprot:XP_764802.1 hypothetical protein [Theileria parva strain Muguga]
MESLVSDHDSIDLNLEKEDSAFVSQNDNKLIHNNCRSVELLTHIHCQNSVYVYGEVTMMFIFQPETIFSSYWRTEHSEKRGSGRGFWIFYRFAQTVCVYKTSSEVKYCLVEVEDNVIKLLKHDLLTDDLNVTVTKALLSEDILALSSDFFLLFSKDKDTQDYPFSHNIPQLNVSKKYNLFFKEFDFVRLVNDYIVCTVKILENGLNFNFYELYSETHFHNFTLKLDYTVKHIHSMMYDGMYKILIQDEELNFLVVSFYGELPTETISYYDHYQTFPEPTELEALIDSSEVVITNKLVDHIISNKLQTCAKKILKCIHLPEQKDFDEEMIKKLQELVDGCQKEHLDLQSLLSYTNTLLDNKFKHNTNQLITTMDISLD